MKSTMTDEEYEKAVLKANERILADRDIFQIFLSRRFERQTFNLLILLKYTGR